MAKTKPAPPYHHGDLHNALIEAGLQILAQDGAQALTLREVARRASVSHTAPYRHFASKEALLVAIAAQGFHELAARLQTASAQPARNPRVLFEHVAWAYVKFAIDKPDHLRVMFSDLITDWDAYPALRSAGLDAFHLLVELIRAGQKAGAIRPGNAQHMAVAGWSSVHGLALLLTAGQIRLTIGETDPQELAHACARAFVQGIARPSDSH